MRILRVFIVAIWLAAPSLLLAQTIDQLSAIIVFLYRTETHPVLKDGKPVMNDGKPLTESHTVSGTGFLVTPGDTTMVLVTAEHVAALMKPDFHATIRGENDTPLDLSSDEFTGTRNVTWVAHGTEDVAVTILHPNQNIGAKLLGRFLQKSFISSDTKAPSRDRALTTLGFPLALGVVEHFSPISRDSKPASGLITLPRFDTHKPATFFLLSDPSISGFSGAPVLLTAAPYSLPNGGMAFPATGTPIECVGIVHGTINDETGGKMAAVTPSIYILETIEKAIH